jgi:hypothetical protein
MIKRTANSASEALELLWGEGFFKSKRDFKNISQILEERGNNFSKPELGTALRQANFLTRSGKRRFFKYIQRLPSVKTKKITKDLDTNTVAYVNAERIKELKSIHSSSFDLTRLIETCNELNYAHKGNACLTVPLLVRSILDHVPPIFDLKTFKEVANNYGTKSFKESMNNLENSSRKIADSYLHTPIRAKEALPNNTQVNFANDFDVLLQEIFRILK